MKLKEIFAKAARERQREGGKKKVLQKSGEAIRTDKKLAKEAGVSHDTISKVENIEKKATEEEQEEFLDAAVGFGWAVRELREAIRIKIS